MVRLSAPPPEEVGLRCDNYAICHSEITEQGSRAATAERARAKGWHLFDGVTLGGSRLISVLCRQCVGRRQLERAPETLPGQEELF